MKANGGVELYLHLFLTLALGLSGSYHTLAILPPGKEPPVHIKVDGPESHIRCYGEEKNLLSLLGIKLQIISPQHGQHTD